MAAAAEAVQDAGARATTVKRCISLPDRLLRKAQSLVEAGEASTISEVFRRALSESESANTPMWRGAKR